MSLLLQRICSRNITGELTLCMLGNFCVLFCRLLIFSKSTFSKNSFGNTIRVSNGLDPDQGRHSVGPDLGPNCLQKLSADGTNRQKVNVRVNFG